MERLPRETHRSNSGEEIVSAPAATVTVTTEVLDSLIADSVELMTRQAETPTIVHGPVIAYGTVTTLAPPAPSVAPPAPAVAPTPAPSVQPFLVEPERFWDGEKLWLILIALKWGTILGIGTLLGVYVVWPVVTLVATVVSFVGELGSLVGALGVVAFVLAVAYWATSLLGFWDHAKPARPQATAPASVPQAKSAKAKQTPVLVPQAKPVKATQAPPVSIPQAKPAKAKRTPPVKTQPAAAIVPEFAHLVGRRGTAACGAVMKGAHNARRSDPKCECCKEAVKSPIVNDDGSIMHI